MITPGLSLRSYVETSTARKRIRPGKDFREIIRLEEFYPAVGTLWNEINEKKAPNHLVSFRPYSQVKRTSAMLMKMPSLIMTFLIEIFKAEHCL